MSDYKKEQPWVSGGYESFTERGGFEDIYVTYDSETLRYFLDGAKALIDELEMDGVESVLDVGTGTGHIALEVAKRYPNLKVVGVDNSTGMLSKAEIKKGDISNVSFIKHDWEQLESMEGKYDVVTNSFGVNFVKDMDKFATSVFSKINPKGKFAFVNFADGGFEPLSTELFSDLFKMSLLRREPTPVSPANDLLIKLMEERGLETLKVINKQFEYPLEKAEQWWTVVSRTAIRENFFNDLTENELEEFKCEHLKNIQKLIDNGCNKLLISATIFVGRAN